MAAPTAELLSDLQRRLEALRASFEVEKKRSRAGEIARLSEDAGFWNDNAKAQALLKEKAQLEARVAGFDRTWRALEDARALHDLAEEARDDAARAEAAEHAAAVENQVGELEFEKMLS